jgi:hypothetical protein
LKDEGGKVGRKKFRKEGMNRGRDGKNINLQWLHIVATLPMNPIRI